MKQIRTLAAARETNGVLIAVHRGMVTGNIPHNTIPAFEAALRQGADILETDVTRCADGTLFIFHPKQEKNHLMLDVHLEELSADQIRPLCYVNSCNARTEYGIPSLDEFLETFKNRCLINLDHGWKCLPEMIATVRHHKMEEQVLIKSPANLEYARMLETLAPDMMYMPIFKETDTLTPALEQMNVNFCAAELVFAKDDSILAEDDYLQSHHRKGRLLWCNTILFDCAKQLSGGHTDDISVTGDPDNGWGWVIDKGFDVIQTDWSMPLRAYIDSKKAPH